MRRLQERGAVPPLSRPLPSGASRLVVVVGVAVAVVTADQLTKSWALRALQDGPVHVVGTLRLSLSFNTGAAFGLARDLVPLLVGLGILVVVALMGLGRSMARTHTGAVALGLVLGGALGNLGDRLFRGHGGAVIDFIDLQWWPVFNLADAAITCGVLVLVASGWRRPPR